MVGKPVVLHEKTYAGVDAFNNPIYTVKKVTVENVLIGQPSTDDITASIEMYGKRIEFMLGLPKGDTHNWEDTVVEFFGHTFRTFGFTQEGIEENVPTPWHKKVRVERYG